MGSLKLSEIEPKCVKSFVGLVTKKSLTDTLPGVEFLALRVVLMPKRQLS